MTNPKIAPWQAVFRTIDESGYSRAAGIRSEAAANLIEPHSVTTRKYRTAVDSIIKLSWNELPMK
jgi:hypothetical protein